MNCYFAVYRNGIFNIVLPEGTDDSKREKFLSILCNKGYFGVSVYLEPKKEFMDVGFGSLPIGNGKMEIRFTNSIWDLLKWMNSLTMHEAVPLYMNLGLAC